MNDKVQIDYIHGGQGFGGVATRLLRAGMDPDVLRPWVGDDGRTYIRRRVLNARGEQVVKDGKKVYRSVPTVANAGVLRRDGWLQIDKSLVDAPKVALRVVSDFEGAGLTEDIDGLATPVLGYEMIGRITGAKVSMNGLRQAESDLPEITYAQLPIPIIHKDIMIEGRFADVDARSGSQIKTTAFADAGVRVMEEAEKMALGVSASYMFQTPLGAAYVYGLINYPGRITGSMTLPTTGGWTAATAINELIIAKKQLRDAWRPGPYFLYISPNWEPWLDRDYSTLYNGETLRSRLAKIEGFGAPRISDWLTGYQMVIVQASRMNMDIVRGMPLRTLQWEEQGGFALYFKVMTIIVPRIRSDVYGNSGIWHAIAA